MRKIAIALILASGLAENARAQDAKPAVPKANPDDVKSVDAIVAALYDVISGPKDKPRDWDRMRSLFLPGARLIPANFRNGTKAPDVLSVEDFIKLADRAVRREGFFEAEVARKAETFGGIAHVFSTYESRTAKDERPIARGINSIQLYHDGERWHIVTVLWDAERPGLTIPDAYLPKK